MSLEYGLMLSAIGIAWVFIALAIIATTILALRRVLEEKPQQQAETPPSEDEMAAIAAVISKLRAEETPTPEAPEAGFKRAEERAWQVAGRIESTQRRPSRRGK